MTVLSKSILRLSVAYLATLLISTAEAQLIQNESVDLSPLFTLPKQQGTSGACGIFAVAAALEIFPAVPKISETQAYFDLMIKNISDPSIEPQQPASIESYLLHEGSKLKDIYSFLRTNTLTEKSKDEDFQSSLPSLIEATKYAKEIDSGTPETVKNDADRMAMAKSLYYYSSSTPKYLATDMEYFTHDQITPSLIIGKLRQKTPVITSLKTRKITLQFNIKSNSSVKNKEISEWELCNDGKIGFNPLYEQLPYELNKYEHAVLIVGYKKIQIDELGTSPQTVYIIRNSWGTNWGIYGYGYITESHLLKYVSSAMTIEGYRTIQPIYHEKKTVSKDDFELKIRAVRKTGGFGDLHMSLIRKNADVRLPLSISYTVNGTTLTENLRSVENSKLLERVFYEGVTFTNLSFSDYIPDFLIPKSSAENEPNSNHHWIGNLINNFSESLKSGFKRGINRNNSPLEPLKNKYKTERDSMRTNATVLVTLQYSNREIEFKYQISDPVLWTPIL